MFYHINNGIKFFFLNMFSSFFLASADKTSSYFKPNNKKNILRKLKDIEYFPLNQAANCEMFSSLWCRAQIDVELKRTRTNEFGTMTARKDHKMSYYFYY